MAKAIVTGGAGFIGSHLAEELARRGYQVVILDDLSTGKMENIKGLLDKDNVTFVQGSITELPLLQKLFDNVDYVFHQAALARVPFSIQDPLAVNEANISGTLKVLWAAKRSSVKKVIYAASSSAYGNTASLPQREDMPPDPLSPYALTKLTGEYYCNIFREIYGLSTVCLRYFNVYGPRQDPNSEYAAVIPKFIKRVSEGKPLIIFDDGEQTRDFVFVSDVVQANVLAAESNASGVFNIGQGRRLTINELAKLIIHIMNKDIETIHQGARMGDIKHSLADISKAKGFGYEPKYDLERGLRESMGNL